MTEQPEETVIPIFANRLDDSWLAICRSGIIDTFWGRITLAELADLLQRWTERAERAEREGINHEAS